MTVLDAQGETLASGPTNAKGIFRTLLNSTAKPNLFVAERNGDIVVSGLSSDWRSGTSDWWWGWRPQARTKRYSAYLYTDRPIYKPNQTVFFKTIVRKDDDAVLSLLPENTPLVARIRDARGNVVRSFDLRTNALGTAHGQFAVADGAMLGDYALDVLLDGELHSQTFKVQDYAKSDFGVTVVPGKAQYIAGEPISATVNVSYLSGQPVANAKLNVRAYSLHKRWYWFDEGNGASQPEYDWLVASEGGRYTTDASGALQFTFPNALQPGEYDPLTWGDDATFRQGRFAIEVSADDGSGQPVSSAAMVDLFSHAEQLTWKDARWAYEVNQPLNLPVQVQTITGQPVPSRTVTLDVRRYNWDSYEYDNIVTATRKVSNRAGEVLIDFVPPKPGGYKLTLTSTDALGNEMQRSLWVWATDKAQVSPWGNTDAQNLRVRADRAQYAPGEFATLTIDSTFSGQALLTFERGTTRRERLVKLTAPQTRVRVPVQEDDGPNIFVAVNAWQQLDTTLKTVERYDQSKADARLVRASTELVVPMTAKQLSVQITPNANTYAPRDEATFELRVTDWRGKPVQAELSFALVDEAIFKLSDDLSKPIFEAMFARRENAVTTFDVLSPKRWLFGNDRGGGGGGGAPPGEPRSDFPDTAIWLPTIQTDADGRATIKTHLPDSLTQWRATVRAVTAQTQAAAPFGGRGFG